MWTSALASSWTHLLKSEVTVLKMKSEMVNSLQLCLLGFALLGETLGGTQRK